MKLKYSTSIVREKEIEEKPGKEFVISNANDVLLGLILLYKGLDKENYNLSLEYTDIKNVLLLSNKEIEDL